MKMTALFILVLIMFSFQSFCPAGSESAELDWWLLSNQAAAANLGYANMGINDYPNTAKTQSTIDCYVVHNGQQIAYDILDSGIQYSSTGVGGPIEAQYYGSCSGEYEFWARSRSKAYTESGTIIHTDYDEAMTYDEI